MRLVAHVLRFGEMKITYKIFSLQICKEYLVVDQRLNSSIYRKYICSGMSTEFVWLSIEGTTVTTWAMLSVRDSEVAKLKYQPVSRHNPEEHQTCAHGNVF